MTRRPRILWPWGAALAMMMFPAQALPQPRAAVPRADSVASALARLSPGKTVRLATLTGASVRGTLVGMQGDAIALLQEDEMVTRLRLEEVTGAWVRGRHTKLGAILGGVAGLGGGVFLGLIVNGVCEVDCDNDLGVYAQTVALGVASGVVLGAVVGAAIPKWNRRFP